MANDRPEWRTPNPRPEQRPTVNVAATGISHAVPRLHHHPDGLWSLELIPGMAFHDDLYFLERLTREANERCSAELDRIRTSHGKARS